MPTPAPPLNDCPIIRKLYSIGRGYALYLPAKWVKANVDPTNLHVTVTFTGDGSFTVRPLKLAKNHEPFDGNVVVCTRDQRQQPPPPAPT